MTDDTGEVRWLSPDERAAWLAMLALKNRAFPEIERDLRTNHDMLAVHYHVLVELAAAPDNRLRLTDLADTANLSPSRLSHRLRTLVERGEVKITQDPTDGRSKLANLTAKGQRRLENAAPDHVATVRRVIFDHLGPSHSRAIADALGPVIESLGQHPEYLNPKS